LRERGLPPLFFPFFLFLPFSFLSPDGDIVRQACGGREGAAFRGLAPAISSQLLFFLFLLLSVRVSVLIAEQCLKEDAG